MISPGSASFTRTAEISANCWLNCDVKLAGMCCTSRIAPGKSFGNEGMNFINVAGPPVEAAIITMGNLPPPALAGAPATADEKTVLEGLGGSGAAGLELWFASALA